MFKKNSYNVMSSDWVPVTRGVKIDLDLQREPLLIKTDSVIASNEQTYFQTYTAADSYIGLITIYWVRYAINYYISSCVSYTAFPTDLPVDKDKVWSFTKTEAALTIHCN